ncbi:hypothetical protein LTR17_014471 [Elasticomyces elasticus]|nr:hypothetical protein LTR17_014471 [Elasticomyces elasticus]
MANVQDDDLSNNAECPSEKPSDVSVPSKPPTGLSSKSVSQTTLVIAVVVPVLVLLVIFSLIIYLGIRRGWFVRKGYTAAHTNRTRSPISYDNTATPAKAVASVTGSFNSHGLQELDGERPSYPIVGNQLYQISGDTERSI